MIYLDSPDLTIYVGDVREQLAAIADDSIDCVVTSPPYWGLRDYGTGEWTGGDAGCDHRAHVGGPSVTSDTFRATEHPDRKTRQYGQTCGKCGATRQDRQLGLEATPEEYVENMVAVFREIRRVLTPHGTAWLNLGDSYNAYNGNRGDTGSTLEGRRQNAVGRPHVPTGSGLTAPGLKSKDLVGVPWRVALALQADGWWLRSDVIWSKPNPMPASVTDRPTTSHEYVFLLTKNARYYFDQEAVREPYQARPQQRLTASNEQPLAAARIAAGVQQGDPQGGTHTSRFVVQEETLDGFEPEAPRGADGRRVTTVQGGDGSIQPRDGERWPNAGGRNLRTVWTIAEAQEEAASWMAAVFLDAMRAGDEALAETVWTIATQPYPGAHFATYPEELARRCILAGSPERVCNVCGKPSTRIVEVDSRPNWDDGREQKHDGTYYRKNPGGGVGNDSRDREERGWTDCGHDSWRRGTVLDPFAGSGTTALVTRKHGRRAVAIELNPAYAELLHARNSQTSLFFEEETA